MFPIILVLDQRGRKHTTNFDVGRPGRGGPDHHFGGPVESIDKTEADLMGRGFAFDGGRFVIEYCLGDGTFGQVYKARDTLFKRDVALKVLKEEWRENAEVVGRFEREIRAAARLKHPGIVQILATGLDETLQCSFYAMELVSGVEVLRLPPHLQTILEFFDRLLAALAYAHAHGVIHRDLKPENILAVQRDHSWECKILDFGIARVDEPTTQMTATGFLLGTPDYMSPEQAAGEAISVGPASDLYSVGVLLYELLTGAPPFDGDPIQIVRAHAMEATPPLKPLAVFGEVPPAVYQLIEWMMMKRYADRPESAAVVRERLAGILSRFPTTAATKRFQSIHAQITGPEPLYSPAISVEIDANMDLAGDDPSGNSKSLRLAVKGADDIHLLKAIVPVMKLQDTVPVGRSDEKAQLWDAVQRVAYRRERATVALTGPAGMGKTRLARWLLEMLHEHRPMRVFRVNLTKQDHLPTAIRQAIYKYLRNPRLERRWLTQRLGESVPHASPELANRLTEFLLAQLSSRASLVTGKLQPVLSHWGPVWTDFLAHLTQHPTPMPMLLWIDGPEESESHEAVACWLNEILIRANQSKWPLMVVWSADVGETSHKADGGDEDPIAQLFGSPDVTRLTLGAFDEGEIAALTKQYVPAASATMVKKLHELSKGVPLFARELLLHWMDSGAFVATGIGLGLNPDLLSQVPERLEDLLSNRLAEFIRGRSDPDRVYSVLMQMASLGTTLPDNQLDVLLDGSALSSAELLRGSILRLHSGGRDAEYVFSSELLREILLRRARSLGLENSLRRRAVNVRVTGALGSMMEADWDAAERSLALAVELLDDLAISPTDARRLDIINASGVIATRQREPEPLLRLASVAEDAALDTTDHVLADRFAAAAELWRGMGITFAGQTKHGVRYCRNAYALATVSSDDCARIWALYGQAVAEREASDLNAAARLLRNAEVTGRRLQDDEAPINIRSMLALVLKTLETEVASLARQRSKGRPEAK